MEEKFLDWVVGMYGNPKAVPDEVLTQLYDAFIAGSMLTKKCFGRGEVEKVDKAHARYVLRLNQRGDSLVDKGLMEERQKFLRDGN
jgi:hypothetical protein